MSVRAAAIWAMSSQYMAFAINFIASIYLARNYVGPDALGLFSIAFAATALMAVLQDFGITRFIAGERALDSDKVRTAFSVSLVLAWAIALASIAMAWPMAILYREPALLGLMLVIGASYFLVPLAIVPTALRQRAMDFKSNTLIEVGAALANAVVSILLARRGMGAMALAWGAFAQQAARVVVSQWRSGLMFPWPMRFSGAGAVVRFGGGSSLLILSGSLGGRLPDLILGRLLGQASLGLNARAVGLAGQLRGLVSGAVASVLYPAFARIRDSGDALGPPYQRAVACYTAVTWPTMAGLIVLAEPLIRLVYGEKWLATVPLLKWIALSQMCFVAVPMHVELPILLGRMRRLIGMNFLDTFASVALLALAVRYGLIAAAQSRVAYGLVWMLIYLPFLKQIVGFDWGGLLRTYAKSTVATLCAIVPLLVIQTLGGNPGAMPFAVMLIGTAAGMLLWLVALWRCEHPLLEEITKMAASLLPAFGKRLKAMPQ